jgi:hypothetical protein
VPDPVRPPAGSHDPSVPTGALELSAASLFEAMLAARDAADDDDATRNAFYRALMRATLLLPLPPGSADDARRSLQGAAGDAEEVEIGVMLARGADGAMVNVLFASGAALAAWAPAASGMLPLPASVVFRNLAASGLPAILDPAGPIPYRFEVDEIAALAAGRLPAGGVNEP